MPFRRIPERLLLFVGNHEFREAAIQADEDLWKHPNDGFVEAIEPMEMECDFAAKALAFL